jgi:hypothetical protein
MIRHCTRCELRFRTEAELDEHLATDHAMAADVIARDRYPGGQPARPLYPDDPGEPSHRCLIVANQTLGGPVLLSEIDARVRAGVQELLVVVPATHSDVVLGRARGAGRAKDTASSTDEVGAAQASWRLRMALGRLRGTGVKVRGEVGPADPMACVAQVLERDRVDEVLISTLPPGMSRWLDADVPARIHHVFRIPVTVVTAGAPTATLA